MKIENYLGNFKLLEEHKTAFICSRKIPAGVVLKSYDWAIAMRNAGQCVISGFHSPIEKDVFYFLTKGNQPVILVLARGMIREIPPKIEKALGEGRLLIVSPFKDEMIRVSKDSAIIRNRLIIEMADEIFIPNLSSGGSLEKLVKEVNGKKVTIGFDEKGG
jgi:predicted Rossmann fold nucleotide-binding protein DprA/Smf involved in DNA uptake